MTQYKLNKAEEEEGGEDAAGVDDVDDKVDEVKAEVKDEDEVE